MDVHVQKKKKDVSKLHKVIVHTSARTHILANLAIFINTKKIKRLSLIYFYKIQGVKLI